MNLEEMIKSLLEGQQSLLERVARVEEKLDALAQARRGAAHRAARLERRISAVERVPAGRWNTLAQSALAAVGTAVGAGLLAAAVYFLK